jgi:hypothetical protein
LYLSVFGGTVLKLPIQTGGGGAMSNDNLLEQAKAIHEKYASRDESIDEVCQAHLAADLLPELIAEVERLRSENNRINKLREAEINQAGAAERVYLEAMMVKDARIKELEADRIAFRNLGSRIEDLETYIERLEAAFLEAKSRLIQVTENKSNPCGLPLRYTASERNAMARIEVVE